MIWQRSAATLAFVCASQAYAGAQSGSITLEDALARARQRAPTIRVATARIDEARGRLVGARNRFRENPTIDAAAGPRQVEGATLTDIDVGLSQLFETGGQRAARIAGAEAAVAGEIATANDSVRLAVRETALAFLRTLHAQERLALLRSVEDVAADITNVAERRYAAGDIAVLDVNVAKSALARARAARLAADANRITFASELRWWIGGERDVLPIATGPLRSDRSADLAALLATAVKRPDLTAIEAQITDAEAEVRLGQAATRPDVGVGARFKREEGHRAVIGELTVTLPVFSAGQELRATGTARAARLRLELDATRSRIESAVRSSFEAYQSRQAAVRELEQAAIPSVDENDALARRSFEVGQINLPELLLLRRELVDTRLEYLDRQLEAAEAAVERDAVSGVLR